MSTPTVIQDPKTKELLAAQVKEAKDKEDDKKEAMAFAILYGVMSTNMSLTMRDTTIQTKNFLATQAAASGINDRIAAIQFQNVIQNEVGLIKVGSANKVVNDNTEGLSVTYYATYQGQYVKSYNQFNVMMGNGGIQLTNNFGNAGGFNHGSVNNYVAKFAPYMPELAGLNFYRKEQAFDFQNVDIQDEVVTAQHDYFQNKQAGLTQDETLLGGNINEDGSVAGNIINVIDNVANLMTKLGDEGSNQ